MLQKKSTLADLSQHTIRSLQKKMQFSEIDCLDLADCCLENKKSYDKLLNAYHIHNDEQFSQQARLAEIVWREGKQKPLSGLPVSIKSIFAVEGLSCYAGTAKPLPAAWQREGSMVKRLHAQSCPITGLTHASEFAFGGLGVNTHWGTPRNPWDAINHRVPGGSSSGSALSVISGSAVFALGTDTGGSIRVPATAAGMVGLKTSKGHWPSDGFVPLSTRFDTVGIVSRCVSDSIDIYHALDNADTSSVNISQSASFADFNVCIADDSCFEDMDSSLLSVFNETLGELHKAGMHASQTDTQLFKQTFEIIGTNPSLAAIECSAFIETEIPAWRHILAPSTNSIIQRAETVSAKHYLVRVNKLEKIQDTASRKIKNNRLLISPTLSITPPTLHHVNNEENYSIACSRMLRNTVVANICGFCAITLPIGLDQFGIPIGLQIMAGHGEEKRLLAFAQQVEIVLGTSAQRLGPAPLLG